MNKKLINYRDIDNAWDKLKFLATIKDDNNKHYIDLDSIRFSEVNIKNTLVFTH